MPKIFEKLKELKSYHPEVIKEILQLGISQNFKRNTTLSTHQYQSPLLYFLEKGLIRIYSDTEDKEQTLTLKTSGFLFPTQGFFGRNTKNEYIQFLEDSTLWSLNLIQADQELSNKLSYYKIILEIYELILFEEKEKELMLRIVDAKARFLSLKNDLNQIIYSINSSILASYLRISPKHLNRIKNESA